MIFDVNIGCGVWPFRHLPLAETPERLFAYLAELGIAGGVVRSYRAPWCADLEFVNAELAAAVARHGAFLPAFSVRPDYGVWKKLELRAACLHPAFHGYALTDSAALDMGAELARRGAAALIVVREEDERIHHFRCPVPAVATAEINAFAAALPELKVVVLNASAGELPRLKGANVYADCGYAEPFSGLPGLCRAFPAERLLFGSHAPLFYGRSAVNKLASGGIAPELQAAIAGGNAEKLFGLC